MRQVLLLRGINIGKRRVPMPALRELLTEAGYEDVQTYVQSGNVVLSSTASPRELERESAKLISERFGFEVPVIVRTRSELARVVKANPLGDVADNPKRYQVCFLAAKLDKKTADRLRELVVAPEALVIDGREVYAWHPEGRRALEAVEHARGQQPGYHRHGAQLDDRGDAAGDGRGVTTEGVVRAVSRRVRGRAR